MATVLTQPITVAEFDKLNLPNDRNWELRNGVVVELSFANLIHKLLQHRIFELLKPHTTQT